MRGITLDRLHQAIDWLSHADRLGATAPQVEELRHAAQYLIGARATRPERDPLTVLKETKASRFFIEV